MSVIKEYCVQQKISCIYETEIVEDNSSKRAQQLYKVVATSNVKERALQAGITNAKYSEKLDGTCCYIEEYDSNAWLWARLDRKPCKAAEKKFKKFQSSHRAWIFSGKQDGTEPKFVWNLKEDLKSVPETWIPASGVEITEDGDPKPDDIGHTPGWVPIDITSRQYCWHLQSVDLEHGLILVLTYSNSERPMLELCMHNLQGYVGRTMELIGTNINGNPYKIGCKGKPVHLLVPHGEISFERPPPVDFNKIGEWFGTNEGKVEGVVWQTGDNMFKCHRHHLGLKWPIEETRLNSLPVKINVDIAKVDFQFSESSLFKMLYDRNNGEFKNIQEATQF